MSVRAEIARRVRRPIPAGHSVIEFSLPVISFGDAFEAQVATIALNPSWHEFWDRDKQWLDGDARRLESLRSLGLANPQELTDHAVSQVIDRSNSYFRHNPYRQWFNPLNTLISEITGMTYYDGTACHLDLVQWATHVVQGDMGSEWQQLVRQDRDFLAWQMETTTATTFVLNGRGVIDELRREGVIPTLAEEKLTYLDQQRRTRSVSAFYAHENGKTYVGWNVVVARGVPAPVRPQLVEVLSRVVRGH